MLWIEECLLSLVSISLLSMLLRAVIKCDFPLFTSTCICSNLTRLHNWAPLTLNVFFIRCVCVVSLVFLISIRFGRDSMEAPMGPWLINRIGCIGCTFKNVLNSLYFTLFTSKKEHFTSKLLIMIAIFSHFTKFLYKDILLQICGLYVVKVWTWCQT